MVAEVSHVLDINAEPLSPDQADATLIELLKPSVIG
jgi:hypothetical protein